MCGNVLEWTRSLWGEYPYPVDQQGQGQRENLDAGRDVARVLRGGAFPGPLKLVRCAFRLRNYPLSSDWFIGFRVVLLPSR